MDETIPLAPALGGAGDAFDLLSPDFKNLLWVGISIYLIGMIAVGLWCSRRINGMSDFLVAGRRLPFWMATATLLATWFGAGSSMGVAAEVYSSGIRGVIADPFGASISLVLAGFFVVGFLRRSRFMTVTDIIGEKYGRGAGIYASLWMIPVYIGWLGAQVMGMGTILNLLTGLAVWKGTLIAAGVVLIYTMFGGMWAVTLTDLIQISFIVIGLSLIIPGTLTEVGGLDALLASVSDDHLSLAPVGCQHFNDWIYYVGSWIIMGLGCMVGQDLVQRSLASKNEKVAVSSSILAGFLYMLIALIPILIGFAAHIVFAHYNLQITDDFENKVLPNMAIIILGKLNPIILVLFLSALISAIMSSADSSLLAGSSLLINNVIHPLFPKIDDKHLLKINHIETLVLTVLATWLALAVDSIYKLMINSWASQLVIIFVPVLTAIYLKKASKRTAWLGMLTSTAVWLGFVFVSVINMQIPFIELVTDGMTVEQFLNLGVEYAKYLNLDLVSNMHLTLQELVTSGAFNLEAMPDLAISGAKLPITLVMNNGQFDYALTCGAVYGFVAGIISFFASYLVDRRIT